MSSPVLGQRLRVETTDGRKVTGAVATRNPDSFVLKVEGGGQKTISFTKVKKMEKPIKTYKRESVIIGALTMGLGVGGLAGLLCAAEESPRGVHHPFKEKQIWKTGSNFQLGALHKSFAYIPGAMVDDEDWLMAEDIVSRNTAT